MYTPAYQRKPIIFPTMGFGELPHAPVVYPLTSLFCTPGKTRAKLVHTRYMYVILHTYMYLYTVELNFDIVSSLLLHESSEGLVNPLQQSQSLYRGIPPSACSGTTSL